MSDWKDQELGMHRGITRRDFLNGVALTAGATILPAELFAATGMPVAPEPSSAYYPPALTGLRGSHPGTFEAAHSLRDGTFWDHAGPPVDTGERYDLVIVGGGISGLSAAHFFRKVAGPKVRVLVLDNHDDFGGHAKRNEFRAGTRTMLGFGGTFSIESPAPYSAVAKGLIKELGIDVSSYSKHVTRNLYRSFGLQPKVFFDRESFGVDRLAVNPLPRVGGESEDYTAHAHTLGIFLKEAPVSEQAKADYERLLKGREDYLPGLSSDEKKARLARISYNSFLTDTAKVSPELVKLFQAMPHPLFGLGFDAVSAQDAWGLGAPGFAGMNLDRVPGKGMNRDAVYNEEAERYFFHFPDGNASIARLLVRQLIPQVIPGHSATDVVTARADYSTLDQERSPVRIRLNSTAVRVKHQGDPANASEVEIAYARSGRVYTVRAAHCILACWHVVIPHICAELPKKQNEALASAAKVPLLYTNVALRNWMAFQKLGTNAVYAPAGYHTYMNLDLPVSIGEYQCSRRPEEQVVLHMMKTPCKPGQPARTQHLLGRVELFNTTLETMERNIREQLARILGPGGFDPANDITAITVNRWPHGYAYQYNSLWDSFWLEAGETPCEVARKPFGRLAIANADAGAYAYTDGAIDHAYRAVGEITKG
ncbi:MAG TPA: NAD(P)-binding protein [Terriglobales bacterium]|nr:NAD(P)-binding protein [Terriglobales bacterium]